jgi:hypothetical protein
MGRGKPSTKYLFLRAFLFSIILFYSHIQLLANEISPCPIKARFFANRVSIKYNINMSLLIARLVLDLISSNIG